MSPNVGESACNFHGPPVDYPNWALANEYQGPLSLDLHPMPRPMNEDLYVRWKLVIPATLAGRIEAMLIDSVHQKTIYGARTKLISALMENWLAVQSGSDNPPPVPSLAELRAMGEH